MPVVHIGCLVMTGKRSAQCLGLHVKSLVGFGWCGPGWAKGKAQLNFSSKLAWMGLYYTHQ